MKDSTVDRLWSIFLCFGLWFIYFLLNMFSGLVTVAVQSLDTSKNSSIAEIFMCIIPVICTIFLMVVWTKMSKSSMDLKFLSLKNIGIILLGFLLFRVLGVICLFLMAQKGIGGTLNDQMVYETWKENSMPVILLAGSLSAPIMEEIVFRGGFLNIAFKDHLIMGILISSFLFGSMHHPTDIYSWIIYCGFGIILGIAYVKTKRIEVPIAIHMINNLFALIAMFM